MPTNVLTDSKCKAAQARSGPYKLSDGGGLFLYVTPQGGKLWRLAYRFCGKQKQASFGPYPAVTLAEARAKREAAKALLRDGKDPMVVKKTVRLERAQGMTFRDACLAYWRGRNDVSAGYAHNALRGLEMHLFPELGALPVRAIERAHLLAPLNRMDAAQKHVYVRKVRMWAGQVFDWAIEQQQADINPAALIDSRKAFGHKKVEHFASVELSDVGALLARLRLEGDLTSALACWFVAYTWVRTVEARHARWSEINDGLWIIPAGKMKRARDHVIPLPKQALVILDKMRARSRGDGYIFQAEHRFDRPISSNTILYLLYRIGYKGGMTGHGWRTVASTWANERGYNDDAIERQLSHVPKNKTRATYNRAKYLPERTRMIQDWADWLDSQSL